MKLIFCSSIYRMNTYEELSQKSKVPLSLADHNLNSSIIAGFCLSVFWLHFHFL